MGLLDSILGKDSNNKKKVPPNPLTNPFAWASQQQAFGGAGQSLGGTQPGIVIPISLFNPGPLGVKVEKRPNTEGTAIVHDVVAGSQAEAAGLKRGDILCFGGSQGQAEMHYDIFLEMAKSDHRPLEFEVRRIPINYPKPAGTAGSSSSSLSTTTPEYATNSGTKQSAEADHRKLAVIAAAEAREKANKAKLKPMKQVTKTTLARQQQQQQLSNADTISLEPMTEEAKRARTAAKLGEAQLAQQLGYNPYETARATAGQARTATVAVQHGTVQAATTNESSTTIPGVVASPPNSLVMVDDEDVTGDVPSEVQEALATFFSSWSDETTTLASTCTIMKTLIVNATTKGQSSSSSSSSTTGAGGEEDASVSKFRKVRLANPKIKAALVDVAGAIDVMMAVGFVLHEEDGESFLIFPKGAPGRPLWLPLVLKQLESAAT